MPTSNSRLAYSDCYEIFDQALEDEAGGVRIKVPSKNQAISLRTRLHTARRIDRDENARSYDTDHPMHGKSTYDRLQVKMKEIDSEHYLYLEQISMNHEVESLAHVPEQPLLEKREMKLISPPVKLARRV